MTNRRFSLMLVLALALMRDPVGGARTDALRVRHETRTTLMDPHAAFDVGRVAIRLTSKTALPLLDNPPKLEPWLAESHTVSPDGLTYTSSSARERSSTTARDHRRGRALLRRAHLA